MTNAEPKYIPINEMREIDDLLARYAAARGENEPMWAALAAIGLAGGRIRTEAMLEMGLQSISISAEIIDIPWLWLSYMTAVAIENNLALAGRIAEFTISYIDTYLPNMSTWNQADIGLARPRPLTRLRIVGRSFDALALLHPDFIICRPADQSAPMTALRTRLLCALDLREMHHLGEVVPRETLSTAFNLLQSAGL